MLLIFLAYNPVVVGRVCRAAGVENVLGPIETNAGKPLGNGVYGERLIDDRSWSSLLVDEVGVVEEMAVEFGAVRDRPVVKVIERLLLCKSRIPRCKGSEARTLSLSPKWMLTDSKNWYISVPLGSGCSQSLRGNSSEAMT